MGYEAKVILDSISPQGHRLTTIQATFPRFILAEVNTHRMFSRNSASSRAIPVQRRIEQIQAEPFIPLAFGRNQAGMQAGGELEAAEQSEALHKWQDAINHAIHVAKDMVNLGVHKQWANRVIETYAWHTAVITSTTWSNHDGLRDHPAASPEYQTIAKMMREAREVSTPLDASVLVRGKIGGYYWHLPYVMDQSGEIPGDDWDAARALDGNPFRVLRKVSVGRCAAVSYERQEVKNFEKDVSRYHNMRTGGHMSPLEHVARPMRQYEYNDLFRQKKLIWCEEEDTWLWHGEYWHFCGNVEGWIQDRKMIPNEHDFSKVVQG